MAMQYESDNTFPNLNVFLDHFFLEKSTALQ